MSKILKGGGAFWNELQSEVHAYLAQPGVEKRGYRQMYRKAAIIAVWSIGSYLALVAWAHNWWQVVVCGISLVLAMDGASFSIMHDGNHGGFTKSKRGNRAAGFVLELLGGSSYTWKVKHNLAHHTYPNIDGLDNDIDQPPFARLASSQTWQPHYRWQHRYLWFAYGLMIFRWQSYGDIKQLRKGGISRFRYRGFNGSEAAAFGIGKLLFVTWTLVVPLALHWSLHGVLTVLLAFVAFDWLFSFVLVMTFQVAHCTDEALFISTADVDKHGLLPSYWAEHQVLTTSDFCPQNHFITWFVGGLNYQVEHHLFPHVSHVHYPAIAQMVRAACTRHGLTYLCQPTLRSAVTSHYHHLKKMGTPPNESTRACPV